MIKQNRFFEPIEVIFTTFPHYPLVIGFPMGHELCFVISEFFSHKIQISKLCMIIEYIELISDKFHVFTSIVINVCRNADGILRFVMRYRHYNAKLTICRIA